MSSIWTCRSQGGVADTVGGWGGLQALAVADVEGESERWWIAAEDAQVVEVGEVGEEVSGFGFDGQGDAGAVGGFQDGGEGVGEPLPGGVGGGVRWGDAAEAVHGVGAEIGGDAERPDEQPGAGGAGLGVRVEEGRAVLAAGVEDVPGPGLDGDAEAQLLEPGRHPTGAGAEVRGEGVEVHVVEGQADPVVAEVGEEAEGVVQAEVGESVGAVAEADRHVGLTFRARVRASGTSPMTASPVPAAPARAARAAWSGIIARMPPPTARWVSGGDGLRAAWRRGPAAVRK